MVPRSANRQVLGFIAVSAVLAALFFLHDRNWPTDPVAVEVVPDQVIPMARALVPQATGRSDDVVAHGNEVVVRMPGVRRDFETDNDLYGYVQRLDPAIRASDPDATWMASRVYDYCAGYAAAPVSYARDTEAIAAMGLRTSQAMAASAARVSRRRTGCSARRSFGAPKRPRPEAWPRRPPWPRAGDHSVTTKRI